MPLRLVQETKSRRVWVLSEGNLSSEMPVNTAINKYSLFIRTCNLAVEVDRTETELILRMMYFSVSDQANSEKENQSPPSGVEPKTFRLLVRMLYH